MSTEILEIFLSLGHRTLMARFVLIPWQEE